MPTPRSGKPLRVLVVDDDEVDRLAIQRALTGSAREYEVVQAASLAEALEHAKDPGIDCVLLDNRLPDGDALDALDGLKQLRPELPVVVLTGHGHEDLAVELLKAGAADYLTKATSAERIESAIRGAVRWFRSEQKARVAEEALLASRESLATTLRSVADGVITTDSVGRITYMNPAAARYCMSPQGDSLVGKELWVALRVPEDQRQNRRDQLEAALAHGLMGSPTELQLLTEDGQPIYVQERVSLLLGADRQTASGLVLTLTDVTERRRHEARLEFLLSVGNDLLAHGLDFSRVLRAVVSAAVPRLCRACALAVSTHAGWEFRVEPPSGPLATAFNQLLQEVADAHALITRLNDQGEPLVVPAGEATTLLPGVEADKLGYTAWLPLITRQSTGLLLLEAEKPWERDTLSLARDFAQRIGLALDNALLVGRLEESVRIRDEMLAVVSHDLRSPLNALALATDNLTEELDSTDAAEYADIVHRAIARMNRLIQDLLDTETMASGGFVLTLAPCDPADIVGEVQQFHGPLAEDKGLELRVVAGADLPKVKADAHRLQQVLSNLLGNAIKFTERGHVTLEVRAIETGVRFIVSDSGPGIPAEHLDHVFERFWRASGLAAGSGLGLAIVRGILDAHGSQIHVESEEGEGTRFCFDLSRA